MLKGCSTGVNVDGEGVTVGDESGDVVGGRDAWRVEGPAVEVEVADVNDSMMCCCPTRSIATLVDRRISPAE